MRKSLGLLWLVILLGCSPQATDETNAEDQWNCTDYSGETVVVRLTADRKTGTGTITANENEIHTKTAFNIDGLNLRWNWCENYAGKFKCAFVLEPDGTGLYYRFSEEENSAKPSMVTQCSKPWW